MIDAAPADVPGPHAGARVVSAGPRPEEAPAAVVLVHGRGGSAEGMLALASEVGKLPAEGPDVCWLAPQAAGHTWYPRSFLAPLERNEPHLSSALAVLGSLVDGLEAAGVPPGRLLLLGFSQGGCLATEFAARNARRYGGVVGLSGGLIGPPGTPREYEGGFEGTPVFLGCSDRDPHIPVSRVRETSEVFRRMDAEVTERIYPGMGHTVNRDELEAVRRLVAGLSPGPRPGPS